MNEPKFSLKQVGARIDITDYAKILQQVEGLKLYPDVSSCVRECIRFALANVELDELHSDWARREREKNIEKRARKREKRKSAWKRIRTMFGGRK